MQHKKNYKQLIRPLILILSLIVFCAVLTRVFSGSETLEEYAGKNPELAYRQKRTESGSTKPPTGNIDINEKTEAVSENSTQTEAAAQEEIKDNEKKDSEEDAVTPNPERTEYQQGFYYEPLTEDVKKRITGISYPLTDEKPAVTYEDLRYVSVLYYNFKGIERTGELICNQAIAQDLVEIFYELYRNEYQIEQIALIDEYGGDDTLSMQDNNTSCFNYRVVDGTSSLSKHALGLAIDINPFFNPYVVYHEDGSAYISPQGSETYADRSKDFAYKIDEKDLCYRLFKEHGFTWGGDWNSCKDYQHFQKTP